MGQWLTGDIVSATRFVCRTLRIPISDDGNDISLLEAVNGAINELTKSYNWEQFGIATADETASLMATMFYEYLESDGCMIGAIFPYATENIPSNCLPCEGGTYNNADYPTLGTLLDTIWRNGDGTFTLPDLRGRFVFGVDQDNGFNAGQIGGELQHTLTIAEMPAHAHNYTRPEAAEALYATATGLAIRQRTTQPTQTVGGDTAHNNMPPYMNLKYCIVAR